MRSAIRPFGELLRDWRARRRLSQIALAGDAEISTKHLSFLETGRASPSREMVLRLSRVLTVPLRDRNGLLHAAGFAPAFRERSLSDPELATAKRAVDLVLKGHEPYPALAIDRHWTLVAWNEAVGALLTVADMSLVTAPVNVLRLSLHPGGLAPRIRNLAQWRAHLLERLDGQIDASGDETLRALRAELAAYPCPVHTAGSTAPAHDYAGVAVPLELTSDAGPLSFLSTTTVFGTPVDITLSELALESFFPADEETADRLRDAAARRRASTAAA